MDRRSFLALSAGTFAVSNVRTASAAPMLPDLLRMEDGTRVTTPQQWQEKRRPEILDLFRSQVYGRAPVGRPGSLRFDVSETTPNIIPETDRRQVKVMYEGSGGRGAFDLLLFVPRKAARPVPCFLLLCNRSVENIDPDRKTQSPFWPAEEIVARGYAAAAIHLPQVTPDKHEGFKAGIFPLFDRERGPDSWGAIAAWAWAGNRAMDYLEKDASIDAKRVAVVGHSRGGKTALWCGAQDERFALTVSNDSGCTGAAVTRGKRGERVAVINKAFPHWFCENYKQYDNREEALPVDQHQLIALMAPRLVYVASATEDTWADPEAEFLACKEASPVYQLLGKQGVGAEKLPAPEAPLHTGSIGYHLRTGKHDLTVYDWQRYMDFADHHLRG